MHSFLLDNILFITLYCVIIVLYLLFEFYSAQSQNVHLSSNDAIALINRDSGIFLDLRENSEYEHYHIKDSLHSTLEHLKTNFAFLKRYKKCPIVVLHNNNVKWSVIHQYLLGLKLEKIYFLQGNIRQWLDDDLPVESCNDLT